MIKTRTRKGPAAKEVRTASRVHSKKASEMRLITSLTPVEKKRNEVANEAVIRKASSGSWTTRQVKATVDAVHATKTPVAKVREAKSRAGAIEDLRALPLETLVSSVMHSTGVCGALFWCCALFQSSTFYLSRCVKGFAKLMTF